LNETKKQLKISTKEDPCFHQASSALHQGMPLFPPSKFRVPPRKTPVPTKQIPRSTKEHLCFLEAIPVYIVIHELLFEKTAGLIRNKLAFSE